MHHPCVSMNPFILPFLFKQEEIRGSNQIMLENLENDTMDNWLEEVKVHSNTSAPSRKFNWNLVQTIIHP